MELPSDCRASPVLPSASGKPRWQVSSRLIVQHQSTVGVCARAVSANPTSWLWQAYLQGQQAALAVHDHSIVKYVETT